MVIGKVDGFSHKLLYEFSKDACFDKQKQSGNLVSGMRYKLAGGDKLTGYLNYGCVGCEYLSLERPRG